MPSSTSMFLLPTANIRLADLDMKLPKSQLAKAVFLLILLLLIPFISSSLRPSHLHFLLNIFILVLGVEAGILKAISRPRDEKKAAALISVAAPAVAQQAVFNVITTNDAPKFVKQIEQVPHDAVVKPAPKPLVVQKAAKVVSRRQTLKRCLSKPSIFFVGGFEGDQISVDKEEEEEKWVEDAGEMSKLELFAKAEAFIGNFYMQLKMQREESWRKIHGLLS